MSTYQFQRKQTDDRVEWTPEGNGETLLRTKLRLGTAIGLIDRSHLCDWLSGDRVPRLTLVTAPAGYGKSSLLSALGLRMTEAGRAFGWLSLDQDDNDPIRLLVYLAAAIDEAAPGTGRHALEILRSGQQPAEILATRSLLSAIERIATPITLFVDDAHLLTGNATPGILCRMILSAPANLHFVVASREDLPMDLSPLRLSQNLREIGAVSLALRPDEIQMLAERNGLAPIGAHVLRALVDSTEGWAAGIQLFLLASAHGEDPQALLDQFDGRDRQLSDYLGQAVLRALRPELRDFLLQTAALDRFSDEVCQALLPDVPCKAMIEELDRANLFVIPLDRQRKWYRYHHLFGDFLRDRLETEQPGRLAVNYAAAARWCAANGSVGEAISYAKRGGDYEFAAELIAAASEQTGQYQGDHGSLLHWIQDLPDEGLDRLPQIRLGKAWSLCFHNGHAEALAELDRVERLCAGAPADQAAVLRQSAGMIRCVSACLSGDADTARLSGAEWLAAWPEARDFNRGAVTNAMAYACIARREYDFGLAAVEEAIVAHSRCRADYGVICALAVKGLLLTALGRMDDAERVVRGALDDALRLWGEHSQAAGQMSALLAEIMYETDRIEEARHHLGEGELAAQQIASPELKLIQHGIGARLARLGNPAAALAILRAGIAEARAHKRPALAAQLGAGEVALLLAEGRGVEAEEVARRNATDPLAAGGGDAAPDRDEPHWVAAQRVEAQRDSAIRLALSLGDYRPALAEASQQVADLRLDGRPAALITALMLKAVALLGTGAELAALRAVDEAARLAAESGLIRRIADEEPVARAVLQRYVEVRETVAPTDLAGAPMALVRRLAALCSLPAARGQAAAQDQCGPAPGEPEIDLRPKERQILSLVAQGLSNRAIADSLFLSEKTVKWHLYNAYSKLDVKNRTAAALKARTAGLLD